MDILNSNEDKLDIWKTAIRTSKYGSPTFHNVLSHVNDSLYMRMYLYIDPSLYGNNYGAAATFRVYQGYDLRWSKVWSMDLDWLQQWGSWIWLEWGGTRAYDYGVHSRGYFHFEGKFLVDQMVYQPGHYPQFFGNSEFSISDRHHFKVEWS